MLRLLIYLVTLAILIAAAVWLADRPGAVAVDWLGWRIETSVPVLLIGLFLVVVLFSAVIRFWRLVVGLPGRLAERRREKRRRQGYLALTDGLAAVAAGDAGRARKNARRADGLLNDPPLTLLLSAQAAQLSGDADAAKNHFARLVERPETEFLGLRGLLTQALRAGDQAAALDYARRAHAVNPDAGWLTATLFDLQARAGLWGEAAQTLRDAAKRHVFPPEDAARKRAIVAYERAGQAQAAGDRREALRQARQAHEADPAFPAAAVRLAELLMAEGKERKAATALADTWRVAPHPDVMAAHLGLSPADDALRRLQRAEKLAAANPDHPESHLAVGEQALRAKLWGQARAHLTAAAEARPTARVYRLLAEVEEAEGGDAAAVRDWLAKAAAAAPDPIWLCRQCGGVAPRWSSLCPTCHALDGIAWSDPLHPPPALPAAAPAVIAP
ncbi:MAG: heme biosynthesis protein HemY [Rhodospirillales bacterium]|nr:heme biosynthesis protein HemY [Rhodospirillales bacterium]